MGSNICESCEQIDTEIDTWYWKCWYCPETLNYTNSCQKCSWVKINCLVSEPHCKGCLVSLFYHDLLRDLCGWCQLEWDLKE